jgi:ubiquinone/menaquinone biosynthesis C-methylase UbiE
MKPQRDPEQAELHHLVNACPMEGKDLLEIGCGDGKLIRQYAGLPRHIVGIDPSADDLRAAKQVKRTQSEDIWVLQAKGEHLPFKAQCFDIAIFASSI